VRLRGLRDIASDEISIGKGHRYVTVVLDLETGPWCMSEKQGIEALDRFETETPSLASSESGLSPWTCRRPIGRRFREILPKAVIVFDHFHIIKLFNDKLSIFGGLYIMTRPKRNERCSRAHAGCSEKPGRIWRRASAKRNDSKRRLSSMNPWPWLTT